MVIADPNEVYRMGVRSLVSDLSTADVVGEAVDVGELEEILETTRVDLVMVDPRIVRSVEHDVGVIERVKALVPEISVVVVTDAPIEQFRRAIELGVNACLTKTAEAHELTAALRLVASGRYYIQADLVASLLEAASQIEQVPSFSTNQVTMLELASQGQSNEQIARALHMSVTTLKSHLRLIYSHLAASNRAEAVASAVRLGIIS